MKPLSGLRTVIVVLLFLFAATPLVTSSSLFLAPFVFPKALFYRSVLEISLLLFSVYIALALRGRATLVGALPGIAPRRLSKNLLLRFVVLFLVSAAISSVLATNAYRAFFGDLERGEGLYGVIHYLIFLVLALLLFTGKDWLRFFKISLVVGWVSILYAWLQYFLVTKFPFALAPASQPGSFSGNPAYLAEYLILLLGVTAIVYWSSPRRSFWWYASLATAGASVATIFITAVRGAIIGLAAGALVLAIYLVWRGARRVRLAGAIVLAGLVVLVVGFLLTRASPLWLKVPGFGRLTSVSLTNPSVVTRLIALKVGFSAWQERPILGWGMENFNIAYNRHFDPLYSYFAEDWFDRAHNRLVDVLVTQGVFGLLAFLGMFVALFRSLALLARRARDGVAAAGPGLRAAVALSAPILIAVTVAHFVQNLFLFDQITSYVLFFTLLGLVVAAEEGAAASSAPDSGGPAPHATRYRWVAAPAAVLVAVAIGYSLYTWNYLPAYQASAFGAAIKTRVGQRIFAAADTFLTPYNFAQMEIRAKFVELMYSGGLLTNKKFDPLVNRSLDALEEVVNREPYEPRNFTRLVEAYNERAKDDPSIFPRSEAFARRALALSPDRQALRYLLSFALSGEGKHEESIAVVRQALALEPRSAKAHYLLGVALLLAADSDQHQGTPEQATYRAEAEQELDLAREWGRKELGRDVAYQGSDLTNTQYYLFLESDLKNMVVMYRTLGEPEKMVDLLEVLTWFHPTNKDYRYDAIIVYRSLRDADGVIRHAEALKRIDPSLADQMDVLTDLARKQNWEILDTL